MTRTVGILFRLIVLICGIPSNESTTGESVDDWTQCPPPSSRFKVLIDVSIKQCTAECETRPACAALGYLRRPRVCELYDKPEYGGGPGSRTTTSHCIFVNKDNIKQQNGDSCNCPNWSVCDRKTKTCTIKECKPLRNVTHGKILGNRYDVGARLRVICAAGYDEVKDIMTLTCEDSGNWSHMPSCVPRFYTSPVVNSMQPSQGYAITASMTTPTSGTSSTIPTIVTSTKTQTTVTSTTTPTTATSSTTPTSVTSMTTPTTATSTTTPTTITSMTTPTSGTSSTTPTTATSTTTQTTVTSTATPATATITTTPTAANSTTTPTAATSTTAPTASTITMTPTAATSTTTPTTATSTTIPTASTSKTTPIASTSMTTPTAATSTTTPTAATSTTTPTAATRTTTPTAATSMKTPNAATSTTTPTTAISTTTSTTATSTTTQTTATSTTTPTSTFTSTPATTTVKRRLGEDCDWWFPYRIAMCEDINSICYLWTGECVCDWHFYHENGPYLGGKCVQNIAHGEECPYFPYGDNSVTCQSRRKCRLKPGSSTVYTCQ